MDRVSNCGVYMWQKMRDDGEVSRNLLSGFDEDAKCRSFLLPFCLYDFRLDYGF